MWENKSKSMTYRPRLRRAGSKLFGPPGMMARSLKRKMKRVARGQIRYMSEKKWFTAHTANNIDFSGQIDNLTQIPQGDTDLTRDGDQVRLTSFQLRANIRVGDNTNTIRLIVFRWNDNNAVVVPAPADLITAISTGEAPLGAYQQDNVRSRRFNVLFDRLYSVDANNPQVVLKIKKRMSSTINFNGGGTGGRGHIYFMYISDSGAATHPTINYAYKFVFIDN